MLESKGWVVGDTRDFPRLSEEECKIVELKMSLARGAKELRERLWLLKMGLWKMGLAEKAGLRQSRVGETEAGDRSVSLDLTLR